METLFMRAFERQHAAEAQMRQQAASYSRTLACGLLAAGHQPPPWLLPHPAAFAALFHRGAAEEQMQLQVEAYSLSIACALVDAGHLPPPWLLPHRASGEGTSERSVPADAQMRKQVVSYSLSAACALLAAGHRPPPWLLQSPADVATTEENTVRKASVYLADPQNADHVQHELSEINHQVKQNTLEAPRFQTFEASNSLASPPLENGSSHSTKSNFLEGLDCVSCPLPENGAIDIVGNVSIEVSQGWPQTDVSEETYYMPIVLPDKEARHSSETPADVATQGNTIRKASIYLADPQSADHVQHELSEINRQVKQNTLGAPRFQAFEASNSMASPPLENGSSHSTKFNFLEGLDCVSCPVPKNGAIDIVDNVSTEASQGRPQTDVAEETFSMPIVLLDKEAGHSSETTYLEGPICLVGPKMENDLLQTIEQSGKLRKRSSLLDRCDNESSRTLEQQSSGCHVLSAPNNESALQPFHLADTTEAHDVCVWNNIDITARPEALSAASSKRARVSHTLERNSVISSDKSVPMLECQSFCIPVPSDSPTITERALQGFCESKKLVNFCSSLSVKYKIKPLGSVYQSLPSRFENLMNRSLSYSIDIDQSYASKYSLDFDDAFMMSNGQTSGSSNVCSVQDDSDVPLNLPCEKYDLRKLPAVTESSSDYLGSISGFGCSKIDEDSTILGGNKNQAKPSHSIGRNCSRQCLSGRKPLGYATKIYQSKGTSSLDLTAGKSYIRKPDQHVHIRVNQDIKNPKEVRALSIMNAEKITHSLHDGLRQTEMSCSKSERNRREPHLEKGCRPQNTVSNLTSFIRLAKQNQQPPISCAKRDVRVRALKVAAAAKRREEKRQTEREMHKAAVKLALERSKQEKEHRQKQVEHRKKMGADFITRKRQREGDGKRENGRKKKCAKEALKHQKQLEEIIHSPNTVNDACPKDTDGKDLVENLVQRVGNQLLSDERMESVQKHLASESNSVKAMYADCKSAGSGLQVQENLSDNVDKSYGMTPYEDSDAKDFEVLEHQREIRRRHKLVPSWAQEGNLDKILVSNLALDSREVFAHKCSAILSDVLTRGNPHRPIY